MRRPHPSGTLASLVALLVLAASETSARGAGAEPSAWDFTFEWAERAEHAETVEGRGDVGAPVEVPFALAGGNLTVLRFVLHWDDDLGKPDTLSLRVTSPSGVVFGPANATASKGGVVEILARVAEVPPGSVTIRAATEEAAWRDFHGRYPASSAGTGRWIATVTVEEAGDGEGVLGLPRKDAGNAWELAFDLARYAGTLAGRAPVEEATPPTRNPTEMPPVGTTPSPLPTPPSTPVGPGTGDLLAWPGVKSLLVVAAAVLGASAALFASRWSGTRRRPG